MNTFPVYLSNYLWVSITWYLECCILGSLRILSSQENNSSVRCWRTCSTGGDRYITWLVMRSSCTSVCNNKYQLIGIISAWRYMCIQIVLQSTRLYFSQHVKETKTTFLWRLFALFTLIFGSPPGLCVTWAGASVSILRSRSSSCWSSNTLVHSSNPHINLYPSLASTIASNLVTHCRRLEYWCRDKSSTYFWIRPRISSKEA